MCGERLEVSRRKRRLRFRVLVVVAVGVGVEVLTRLSIGIGVGVSIGGSSVAVHVGHGIGRLSAEVLLALCCTIAHGSRLGTTLLGHLHLGLVALVVLAAHGGQEVDEEAQHVPCVDEGNNPFEYSGYVPVVVQLGNTKDDAKTDPYLSLVCLSYIDIEALTLR